MKTETFKGRPWWGNPISLFGRVQGGGSARPAEPEPEADLELPSRRQPGPVGGIPAKRPVVIAPIDFLPASLKAADQAIKIAHDSGALLLLVHAVYLNLTPYGPANPAWLKSALCQEAMEKAEPVMNRARQAGVTAVCAVEQGSPETVIVKAAQRWHAKLIIFAAPTAGRLAHLFGNKTVQKVVRQADCPVLVINHDQTAVA